MGLFIRILKGQKNMWLEKQRKYPKNICSRLMLAILLLASVITLTACRSSNIKETTKQTDHKTKKWEPLVITKQEKAQAQKEVKQISDICQNIKINENKVTKKDLHMGCPASKIHPDYVLPRLGKKNIVQKMHQ